MRNRGVEIFVTGPAEENAPPLDLRALLAAAGVPTHEEQRLLLAAHHTLRALVTGNSWCFSCTQSSSSWHLKIIALKSSGMIEL